MGVYFMSVKAGIISIGDELMNGFTIDSNSSWIANQISMYSSVSVSSKVTVGDDSDSIKKELNQLINDKFEYIFITGGLGPTHDDITKRALLEYFNCSLKIDQNHYKRIKNIFKNKGSQDLIHLKEQSEILDISSPISNKYGTALGMSMKWCDSNIFIMPGVPREMKGMMQHWIIPNFISNLHQKKINHITILTTGIYESKLSMLLKSILDENLYCKVAFLPNYSGVKLRLSIDQDVDSDRLFELRNKIIPKIDKFIYGYDNDKMEVVVSELLVQSSLSISIAESCTGGYLSKLLTDVSGSSRYFKGSVIAYSNDIKRDVLEINSNILKEHGAVSEHVALEMAKSIKKIFKTDIGVSTTGISGPGGGTIDKPVGLIYICVIYKDKQVVKKFNLPLNRLIHREVAINVALNMIRLMIK